KDILLDRFGGLKHLFVTIFMSQLAIFVATPAMPDVTMTLLCPAQDECSLVIYLSSFQRVIIGIALVVMMPIIGNLSDVYGRKALPLSQSLSPSFPQADHMSQAKRASAIGILPGVGSAAFVCGTLADHFLSTSQIFLVATIASTIAAVYMQIFLEDTARVKEHSIEDQPILRNNEMEDTELDCETTKNIKVFKKFHPSKISFAFLGRGKPTFSLAASVAFLNSLAGGEQAPFQYFLKARFHFKKDNFADVMLIANFCSATSQLLLMPMLAPLIGEEVLLCLGLIAGFTNLLIDSVARKIWIPYTAALLPIFTSLVKHSIQSIVSKQIGASEQHLVHWPCLGQTNQNGGESVFMCIQLVTRVFSVYAIDSCYSQCNDKGDSSHLKTVMVTTLEGQQLRHQFWVG
ncbi:hypothetical protein H5410_036804, partial [Solanum commersonii]